MPEPMKYEKILDALEELLTSRDMQAITVREIAQIGRASCRERVCLSV